MEYNKEEILEQLFDTGCATTKVEIIADKLYAGLRTLSAEDYLTIDTNLIDTKSSKLGMLQKYGIERLSYGLDYYKKTIFKNPSEAKEFIKKLPASMLEKLLQEQNNFEKFVRSCLNIKDIDKAFFEPGVLPEKQEQSPKESIQENQRV